MSIHQKLLSSHVRASDLPETGFDRRLFLQLAGGGLAAALASRALGATPPASSADNVTLPPLNAIATEQKENSPGPSAPPSERVGFAIVGIGHLALGQVLPAFAKCKYAKPVALVSGDHSKAEKIAHQYGIKSEAIYNYENYEKLADNPEVKVIYVILPNGMHAEYTVRGAKTGKHILCEKPMANSVEECEQMIAACNDAKVKLMIAYRNQYEPLDRSVVKSVRLKKLGALREFVAANSQNQGDPKQWRLNRKMAGGGPVPDVGIYCINAARFLSGEEPTEVFAQTTMIPDDPRFREVEASAQFLLKFPSGYSASCSCSYDSHRSQFLRLQGSDGWAELSPAFAYTGLRLRMGHLEDTHNVIAEPAIEAKDQFAQEMDHMAQCVANNRQPHTPGEEGLQDQRIVDAIYQSAKSGKVVKLAQPAPTRGPEPEEEQT